MPSNCISSNCIFYTTYKHYYSSAKFIINRLRALYKTYKSYKVNLFLLLFFKLIPFFNSIYIYIGEKKYTVLIIFSGPSAGYKLNYNYRCDYYCNRRCNYYYFSLYFPPPYTAYINLAATYYSPPYYRLVRY